ncbi:hypothetical protein [uncultured Legionella sp.]|uniref:hypothetical protein n=1 Tax=uncultured Legionella sp. TaxID=210934 RepID=UPI0026061C32|nr:hypothetical protein [uncultured Legionella sp.]
MPTPKIDSLDDESNIPFLDLNNTDEPQPISINAELANYLFSLLNEVERGMHQYGAVYRCDIPLVRSPQPPSNHLIATLQNLNTLIDVLKNLPEESEYSEEKPCYSEKYSVRYLVTPGMQILFAREGRRETEIPGHQQMYSKCLAAGNIFFSKDYSRIQLINNSSGDFCPEDRTIIWPLIILALCHNQTEYSICTPKLNEKTIITANLNELIPNELKEAIIKNNNSSTLNKLKSLHTDPFSTPPAPPQVDIITANKMIFKIIELVSKTLIVSQSISQEQALIQTEQTSISETPAANDNNLLAIGFFSKSSRRITPKVQDEEEQELRGEHSGKISKNNSYQPH